MSGGFATYIHVGRPAGRLPSIAEAALQNRLDVAIFADPAFSLGDDNDPLYSPAPQLRNDLGRLPFTRIEADSILDTFAVNRAIVYTDAEATITNFLQNQVRTARILHIAAHGFASASDPLFLGLALANEGERSGLLTTEHINAHRFSNELVVISACETAQGQMLKGEGLMSVSRAFLANGARATISTLWPVSDRANAAFMNALYDAIRVQNMDTASALIHAQRTLKRNPRYQHPFYWGAFVLQVADARFAPIAESSPL